MQCLIWALCKPAGMLEPALLQTQGNQYTPVTADVKHFPLAKNNSSERQNPVEPEERILPFREKAQRAEGRFREIQFPESGL